MRELDRGSKQNLTAPVHPTTPILYMVVDVAPSLDSEASEAIVFLALLGWLCVVRECVVTGILFI